MCTPTLKYAGKLPSDDRYRAGCAAGEQIFDDSLSLRPTSWANLRTAEITLIKTILIYEPEVRASARGTLRTIPGVDFPLLAPPARPQGERRPLTWLPLHDADAWPSCAVDSALCSSRLLDIKMSIMAFSSTCACVSANFVHVRVALRSASVFRVKARGRPRVALACSACLLDMVATPRGPGTLHVLSMSYELIGDQVAASAELMVSL